MSHHSGHPFDNMDWADQFKKSMPKSQAERINEELAKSGGSQMFGKTKTYPDGKITDNDEGAINFGITHAEDRVILNFQTSVHWIGFTKEQAIQVANSLLKNANEL